MPEHGLARQEPTPPRPDLMRGVEERDRERELVLRSALRKRAVGAPTFSVPEAAALLSISREHLYKLVRADAFPVLHVRVGADQGRYVIPARAVEHLLEAAAGATGRMDIADWTNSARAVPAEGGDA
jgi:hypothetical protein